MMKALLKRHHLVRKSFCLVLIAIYFFNDIGYAQVAAEYPLKLEDEKIHPFRLDQRKSVHKEVVHKKDLVKLRIPKIYGETSRYFHGKSDKFIFVVQDSHANYTAQKNCSKILETIQKYVPIDLMGVEGAQGEMSLILFQSISEPLFRQIISNHFLSLGYLNGAEYFGVFNPRTNLFGIETRDLYMQNLKAFQEAHQAREKVLSGFHLLKSVLSDLQKKILDSRTQKFIEMHHAYQDFKLPFTSYIQNLQRFAAEANVSLKSYKNFTRVLRVFKLQGRLDLDRVESEQKSLMKTLSEVLLKRDLKEFLRSVLAFRSGKISDAEFYDVLRRMVQEANLKLLLYPELEKMMKMTSIMRSISKEKLELEFSKIEDQIRQRLITSPAQKKLIRALLDLGIYEKLIHLSLSREDFSYFQKHRNRFESKYFSLLLKHRDFNSSSLPAEVFEMEKSLSIFENFYSLALQRDQAFISNLLNEMNRKKIKTAALFAGGFHTQGIIEKMQKQDISYLVITPRMIDWEIPVAYMERMFEKTSPLQKIMVHRGNRLSPPLLLSVSEPLLARELLDHQTDLSSMLDLFYLGLLSLRNTPHPLKDYEDRILKLKEAKVRGDPLAAKTIESVSKFQEEDIRYRNGKVSLHFRDQRGSAYVFSLEPLHEKNESSYPMHQRIKIKENEAYGFSLDPLDRSDARTLWKWDSVSILASVLSMTALGDFSYLPLAVLAPFCFRLGWTFSKYLHEMVFHLLPARLVFKNQNVMTKENMMGNTDWKDWFKGLIPFFGSSQHPYIVVPGVQKRTDKIIRSFGWIGSLLYSMLSLGFVMVVVCLNATPWMLLLSLTTFLGSFRTLIHAFYSDLIFPMIPGLYFCGNWGLITPRMPDEKNLTPERVLVILKEMLRNIDKRGRQAAGVVGYFLDREDRSTTKRVRVVNPKRATLANTLFREWGRHFSFGVKVPEDYYYFMGHVRFGTSSAPKVKETHPHQWLNEREVERWDIQYADQVFNLVSRNERLANFISHNGDFNEFYIYDRPVPVGEVHQWLEGVLHMSNTTRGDSPNLAGLIDLFYTQGMWSPSIRLAYVLSRAASTNDIPSEELVMNLSKVFENEFEKTSNFKLKTFKENMVSRLLSFEYTRDWREDNIERFVDAALTAFLKNDLSYATRAVMQRARGTFGLVVSSTLHKGVILSSRGQPLSLAFNEGGETLAYSSERSVLRQFRYRFDLNDDETVEVRWDKGGIKLRIFLMKNGQELLLTDGEIHRRIVDTHENIYLENVFNPSALETDDFVGEDIKDIPRLLNVIRKDWEDSTSFNRQTASEFLKVLKEIANQRREGKILFIGSEKSFDLAQEASGAFRRVLPDLKIKCLSSNTILRKTDNIERLKKSLDVDHNTLVVVVSESGQTFDTLMVTKLLKTIVTDMFIVTGSWDTLMAEEVGQKFYKGAPFSQRIFNTHGGTRISEPRTASSVAIQATLTELLMRVVEDLKITFPDQNPLGMRLRMEDLHILRKFQRDFEEDVVQIVGVDRNRAKVDSKTHRKLILWGKKWASHILENVSGLILGSLILTGTHYFGVSLFPSSWIPMLRLIPGLDFLANAIFLISFSWIVSIFVIRAVSWIKASIGLELPRNLMARIGKRTLVIGDIPYVHRLLEIYVSKLFSLSYGHASVEVHSGDPSNQFVHEFAHRVVRGSLMVLGQPAPTLLSNLLRRQAISMTGSQAKGIQSGVSGLRVGPEVLIIGQNPTRNPNVSDDVIELNSALQNMSLAFFKTLKDLGIQFSPRQEKELDSILKNLSSYAVQADLSELGENIGKILELSGEDLVRFSREFDHCVNRLQDIEELYESRFGSFERLIANYVLFHEMAQQVSFPWWSRWMLRPFPVALRRKLLQFFPFPFLYYDMSRTQSGTNIATTASTVPGDKVLDYVANHKIMLTNLNEPLNQLPSPEFIQPSLETKKMNGNAHSKNSSETGSKSKFANLNAQGEKILASHLGLSNIEKMRRITQKVCLGLSSESFDLLFANYPKEGLDKIDQQAALALIETDVFFVVFLFKRLIDLKMIDSKRFSELDKMIAPFYKISSLESFRSSDEMLLQALPVSIQRFSAPVRTHRIIETAA